MNNMRIHRHRWRKIKAGEQSLSMTHTGPWRCRGHFPCDDKAVWICGVRSIDLRQRSMLDSEYCHEGRCAVHGPRVKRNSRLKRSGMTIQVKNKDILVRCCPFCGSWRMIISNTHTACYTVSCENCEGEITGESFEKTWKSSRSKVADHLRAIRSAVGLWNTRASDPRIEVRPAQLECSILWGAGSTFSNLGGTFGRIDEENHG